MSRNPYFLSLGTKISMNWGNLGSIRDTNTINSSRYDPLTTDSCETDSLGNTCRSCVGQRVPCTSCRSGTTIVRNPIINNPIVGNPTVCSGRCGCEPNLPCSGNCNNPCSCGDGNPCARSSFFIVGGRNCRDINSANTILGNMSMNTKLVTIEVMRDTVFNEQDVLDIVVPVTVRPQYYPRSVQITGMFYCPQNITLDGLTLKNFCLVTSSDRFNSCNTVMITNSHITGDDTYIVNQGGTLKMVSNTFDARVLCRPMIDHICGKTEICGNCGSIALCRDTDTIPMFTYQRDKDMIHTDNTFTFTGDKDSVVFGVDPGVDAEHHDNNYYHICKLTYHAVVEDTRDDNCCREPCSPRSRTFPNQMTFGDSLLSSEHNLYKNTGCTEPQAVLHEGFSKVRHTNTTAYLDVITTGDILYEAEVNFINMYNTTMFTASSNPAIIVEIPDVEFQVGLFSSAIHNRSGQYVVEFIGNDNSFAALRALSGSMLSNSTMPQAYTLTGIPEANSLLANGPFSLVGVVPYTGNSPNEPVDEMLDT